VGNRLGPYLILSILGKGGMGEVYLAHDPRLGRKVAIKLLPLELTQNDDRTRRFQHEARAASTISHPNVAHIYEIGEVDGRRFTAMEYVDGVTLRDRLAQGALKMSEAVEIALQIALALRAAHEAGVVHRDIKPENVMIRRDALVKVLDFGLAKVAQPEGPFPESPTLAQVETDPGTILGTVQYMSPEQARGLDVDGRTDLWSLGCVLYEMITGQTPFRGPTPSDVIAEILKSEPPLFRKSPTTLPAPLISVLRNTLCKSPDGRYQTADEAVEQLQRLRRELERNEPSLSHEPLILDGDALRISTQEAFGGAATQPTGSFANYLSSAVHTLTTQARKPPVLFAATVILVVAIATPIYYIRRARNVAPVSGPRISSLAVLPFKQIGAPSADEYLSQGMADVLINKLSRMRNLNVRPIGAVLKYSTTENDPVSVGHEQRVDAVVEGNILRSGDKIRVTTRMINAQDGKAMWTESFEDNSTDVFAFEDRISERIVRSIAPQIDGAAQTQLTRHYTANADAYQLYLKGRYFWNKRTQEGLTKGAEQFQKAVEIDPKYALAYAGLADCYSLLGSYVGVSPRENLLKAKLAALKAIEIDDSLAEAHTSLAKLAMDVDWNWAESEREFRRAIELNPGYVTAHHWYGDVYLSAMGRDQEAIAEMKRALELDPTSLILNADLAWCYIAARRWQDAIDQSRLTIEMDSNFWPAYHNMAQAYAAMGRYGEALDALRELSKLKGAPEQPAALGYIYGISGQTAAAKRILQDETVRYQHGQGSPYNIAVIYAGLGMKDEAFRWLTIDFDSHDTALLSIKVDPLLSPLHSDSRFAELERRFNFPS
jgi:serine/threonine protein kinase/TolB-like protein/Tfp pilus assembly protein PilF